VNPATVDPATVTTERDRSTGAYRIFAAGVQIGRIARENRIRAAKWQAYDETNHPIPRGPWNTVREAVVGYLAYREERTNLGPVGPNSIKVSLGGFAITGRAAQEWVPE
jgi:hypothetical protein